MRWHAYTADIHNKEALKRARGHTGAAGAARAKVGCCAVSAPEEELVSLLSVDLPQNWPLLGALTGLLALLFFRVYTTCFCITVAAVVSGVMLCA